MVPKHIMLGNIFSEKTPQLRREVMSEYVFLIRFRNIDAANMERACNVLEMFYLNCEMCYAVGTLLQCCNKLFTCLQIERSYSKLLKSYGKL